MSGSGLAEHRQNVAGENWLAPTALPFFGPLPTSRESQGATLLYLDNRRAVLRRAGSPATIVQTIPTAAFRGVAVRITPRGMNGAIAATLELFHRDPTLRVQLAASDDPAEIAADWQGWGEALRLPLLFVDRDGTVTEHSLDKHLSVGSPSARRRRAFAGGRRSRFLQRRKVGFASGQARLIAREIIARS